jgi:hypothetical protein
MPDVSVFRLNLLRATYLLLLVGLAFDQWPGLLRHPDTWTLMRGVVCAMLTAVSLLAVLGLRYPLQMLPLLLFELTWKTIWLLVFALPPWLGHRMTAGIAETAFACVLGLVIFPAVIPWPYVVAHYLKKPVDRWR